MGTPLSAHQRGELKTKLSARLWRAFFFSTILPFESFAVLT